MRAGHANPSERGAAPERAKDVVGNAGQGARNAPVRGRAVPEHRAPSGRERS